MWCKRPHSLLLRAEVVYRRPERPHDLLQRPDLVWDGPDLPQDGEDKVFQSQISAIRRLQTQHGRKQRRLGHQGRGRGRQGEVYGQQ